MGCNYFGGYCLDCEKCCVCGEVCSTGEEHSTSCINDGVVTIKNEKPGLV